MIKTFDDYIKEKKKSSGIQTFDSYVKKNNLKVAGIQDNDTTSVSTYKRRFDYQKEQLNNIQRELTLAKENVVNKNLLNQGIDTSKVGFGVSKKSNDLLKNNYTTMEDTSKKIMNEYKNAENNSEIKELRQKQKEQESKTGYAEYDYNKKRVAEDEITLFDKTLGRGINAVRDLVDTVNDPYVTYDENGNRIYLDTYAQMKEQKVSENYDSKIGKFLGDAFYQVSKIGTSTAGNLVAPGAGTALYWGNMYRNNLESAKKEGHGTGESMLYATAGTLLEFATGKVLGSATKNLTGGKVNEYNKALKGAVSKLIKNQTVQDFLANAGSEATEEFIQEFADRFLKNTILGEDNKVLSTDTLKDALYSAGIGAVSGGILGGKIETENVLNSENGLNNKSGTKNKPTVDQIVKPSTNTKSNENIAHTSSNVVQNLNKQEENVTERLEKIKQLQEVAKQNKKYDQINEVLEEYRNIQEKQNETIQNIENNQNSLINQNQNETVKQKSNLTLEEQKELETLKDLPFDASKEDLNRIDYLEKKQNGLIKYADLIGKNSYDGIKSNYWNYKNTLNTYNPALYNKISEVTPSYRNSGKRTKDEWLGLAKNMGNNFKGDSQSLEKYAVQTWFYASPQNNLNRQGKKFVKFDIGEWLTNFYEGAGVGSEVTLPTNNTNLNNAQVSYSMPNLPMSSYNYVESNNPKINELRQSASKYLNNSGKTTRTIELIEKIIADKDYRIIFNPNITNESGVSVNGLIRKENGQVIIELNPNADNYVEFLIVHEITHDIATKDMKELILNYAEQDPEFEESLETLKERYKTDDVTDEVVADVCGELFGNREFIQSVVEKKPNIFMKILNNIRELAKKIKGSKAEEYVSFVEKLKTMWEDAYHNNESNLNETKYSTIGLKGAKNLSKNNNTREYKNLFNRQKQAEDIHNNSTDTLDNTNIKSKRETGWYKTKYGDWGTLITDKDAKLIKTLEPNKTYRLEEILKHDLLYQAYPMLKNLKVKTADISSSGAHSSIKWLPANNVTNTIFLNNNDISKKDYKNTLLHEINHFIEHKEKYNKMSRGANSKTETKDNYLNNLGEIISNETKINSNLTQDELNDIILPEQAKSKPEYKNIREKLTKSNQKDTIVSVGGKNALQDLEISIQNEIKNNKVVDKKHNKYSRVNEDLGELDNSSFSYDYQSLRPKVRGGWTIEKIQKQLKAESSGRLNSKELEKFDNLDDLMNNIYYHGSISSHDNLKVGSTLNENQRTGGYGETYHTISLSKSKNIASNFASIGSQGTVMPVILKKGAKVVEMTNIEDSIELEDILPELWNQKIDAVKIGDWDIETKGYGEQEIVILNPRAIMTLPEGTTYFQNYHKPKFENMTKEEVRDTLNKRLKKLLDDPKTTAENKEQIVKRFDKILNNNFKKVNNILPTKYSIPINKNNAQELDNSSFSFDNKGRQLTKAQQEYFKNSVVKDEKGNLKVVYHGSPFDFTKFSYDFVGTNGTAFGKGFYLTDNVNIAKGYTNEDKEPMKLYVNITKPMSLTEKNISEQQFKKFVESVAKNDDYYLYDYIDVDLVGFNQAVNAAVDGQYNYSENDVDLIHGVLNTSTLGWKEGFKLLNEVLGYDGVIQSNAEGNVYVALFPEQIKNVDNTSPTSNEDIRYSQITDDWNDYLKENFPSAGTKTKMSDINLPLKENKTNLLSEDKIKELNELDSKLKKDKERYSELYANDKNTRDKYIKSSVMSIAAEKRKIIQGNWLIPIEKGLTEKELQNKINTLRSNYVGKLVYVNDKKGKIFGGSFGKAGVEFEDGTRKYYDTSDIKPVYDLDKIIAKQKEEFSKVVNNIPVKEKKETKSVLPVKETTSKTEEKPIKNTEELATILKEKPKTIEEKDNWLKKLATIKFIDKGYYVDKLARQTKNKELSSKYDYSLLANGIANQIIGNGRVDEKGNKVGKGLYEIFEPIENSGLLDEFSNYIYHKHNVDRMSLTSRFQEENKAVFGDSMTSEMSDKIVKDLEKKYPEFESWAKDIYEYNQANLKMLVKYDVISEDSMKYYNKKYPHYVPTIRHNDKPKIQMDILLGKNAKVNSPIKKARGGNGDIIPLKDAMALRTMQTVNSALKNTFGLELLNTIATDVSTSTESVDTIVDEINVEDLLQKSDKKKPASMSVFLNGEKITFDISDEIYEALKPSNIYTSKYLNKLNNIRRGLLTEYNPTFMITNPLKDIQDGSINSKHPTKFAKNLVEATKQIKNKGVYYQLYIANGGSYETYFNYNTGTNIAPSKIDKIVPLKKISEANELIEMTPRLAEFISSIESGDSIETAMYNASEITTNFKRGGDITKTLDRNGVTFLNAGVQGAVKQIRNVQEARVESMKGIAKLAVRWTISGLAPTLLMGMIWDDDEDYEELSDYIKNNYYILGKYDNGKFIRIPRGRVVSVLQNFFQNVINGINGEEIDLDGFISLLENNVLPSDPNESNLIAPLKQAINNETWYGGELVPTRLQNLPNAEQYDESTDSLSIWLGKKLNISPYKINYVLDQYAGAIGDYTLPFITQQAESGSDSITGKLLAPIKDKFTSDSVFKNQNVTDFYSLSEELTKKSNSTNATDEDKLKNKYINSIKSEMSDLYAEKRKVQSSSQKDSAKYNKAREIQNQINELAKKGLNNYENLELSRDYATIGDREYYLNKNDEWTKVDKTSTKYKTASLLSGYKEYLDYNNEISSIKDRYLTTSSRKNAVIKYVNDLNLSIPQKAILIKMNYSSFDNYDSQIINYVNTSNNSLEDKKDILKSLGFEVYTNNGETYVK